MKKYKTNHYTGCTNMTDNEIEKLNELLQGKIDYFQSRLTKWYEENDVEVYMSYYSSMTSLADGFHNILDYSSIDDDAHKDYWSEVFDIEGALDIVFDVINKWGLKYDADYYADNEYSPDKDIDDETGELVVIQSDGLSQMDVELKEWLEERGIPKSYNIWKN